ncbi:MAG: Stp1/IreP family PP2C-type Ser/Thr phosphatase [Planctomycetes bacterium]|nr:Stp1/IreP family PP2C-type Ser/Thr phosphatase [Planctomycetota bacterium]
MTDKVEIAIKTHVGMVRSENQDHFGVCLPSGPEEEKRKGALVVVADGMGGHSGGQIASHTAADAMVSTFKASKLQAMQDLLEESILAGNEAVKKKQESNPQLREMGTTCVNTLIRGDSLMVAHLGDSRCYMFRGHENAQVTRDHTYLNELIDIGLLTPEQAEGHPDKNIITRCVGMSQRLEIDYNHRTIERGDIFAMCSDGLSNLVKLDEVGEIVRKNEPEKACEILIDLANKRGGDDNITVAVIRINEIPEEDPELAKLDAARRAQANADRTPIIKREDLDPALLDDSEADTAEGSPRPRTSHMAIQKVLDSGFGNATTARVPRAGGDGLLGAANRAWFWLIGAEVLVLLLLQFWIGRY